MFKEDERGTLSEVHVIPEEVARSPRATAPGISRSGWLI